MEKLSYKSLFIILVVLLIGIVGLLRIKGMPSSVQAAWFNASWTYRLKLTIDHTKVGADQTDFPVYVDLSLLPAAFHTNVNQTDARDIRVTKSDGTSELPREVVFYTAASDTGELHFKYTGTLSSTVDTDVYIYYGNASASDYAATDAFGKNNVWNSSYVAVWHFIESSGTHYDSTANNIGSSTVTVTTQGTANFKIGGADDYDGVDDVVDMSSPALLDNLGPFTISAWVYPESGGEGGYGRIIDKNGNILFYFNDIDVSNTIELKVAHSTTGITVISAAETITWNAWQHIAVTWDGSITATNVHMYINGTETTYSQQTNASGTQTDDNTGNFLIANNSTGARTFNGQIDELNVSDSVRSATWISTEYNNQNNPSTFFLTPGDEETDTSATPSSADPVLYLTFNEGYGITTANSVSSSYYGTLSGTTLPTWQTNDLCISDKCLYFNGINAYVNIASTVPDVQTVSFWIKPKTIGETIVDFDGGTHYISASSGTITAGGFTSPTIYVNGIPNAPLTANVWQHLEVTTATSFSASNITIGKKTTYFNGFIDEFKIYDYDRTASQVLLDYNSRGSRGGGVNARFGSNVNELLSSGLVGYWKLDENVGTTSVDSSGNSNTLTFAAGTSAPSWSSAKYGIGLSFDGTTDKASTTSTVSNIQTVSFWMYPSTTAPSVVDFDNGTHYISGSGGTLSATGFTSPLIFINGLNTASFTANTWSLVTITTPVAFNATAITLGKVSTNFYTGIIDELRLYNRVLSPAEIQPLSNWAPGPIGYWKMDENMGTSLVDLSTNGHTMTASNETYTIAAEATVTGSLGDGGGNSFTLTSWTPVANELILVSVAMRNQTITPTVSGNGITFTQIVDVNNTQGQGGITLFRGMSASPTTGSITVTVTGNASPVMAVATRFSGTDITGTNGSGAIEAQATDPGPAVDNNDVKINITTLSTNAWAYAAAWHRNYNLTDPTGSSDITISLNNRAGTNGEDTTDSTWYESAATPSTVTLGSDNNMSTAHDWAIIAVSIKPNQSTNTFDYVSGKYGSAVRFTGTKHAFLADDSDFDFADDESMTITTWFKHTAASAQEIILSKFNEAGYKIIMELDGDITCAMDYDSTWTPTDSATSTAGTYDDDNWHHIACVKTGATSLSLYIDGVLIATDSSLTATNTLTNSDPIYFGIDADGTSNDFSGILDDIKIYNYARTSSQVVEDMNGGHPASKSPVVNYKFDEGYGATTNNSGNAGSDKNGAITSGTWTNSGKFNQALTFTASTSVTTTITDPTYNNTISLWVYPTTSIASKTLVTATKLITDSSSRPIYGSSCIGTALSLSTWTHIVAVSNGSGSCTIYQNGVQTATGTTGVTFGTSINLGGTSYIGSIDEFKFYNFPLTPDQIKLLYNKGSSVSMGTLSTDSFGNASNSLTDSYCPPGQGTTCVGPVAHWKMDENTGSSTLYDTSGNGYNLTINNYYSGFWQPGKMGSAMRTNNADGITTNGSITDDSSAGLDFSDSQDFTISMWTKHISKENTHYILFYNGADSDSSAGYNMATNTSNQFACNYADTDVGPMDSTSSTTLADGNWHFVSCVMDRNGSEVGTAGWHIFVDGRLEGSDTTFDEGDGSGTTSIKLGESSDTYEYSAIIDQVQIFSHARSPSQVAWDFNRGGPLSYYKFDEGIGSTANNSGAIGSTLNATLGPGTSSPTWSNSGKVGKALNFDGNDYLSIGSTASIYSVSLWYNSSNTAPSFFDFNSTVNVGASGSIFYGTGITSPTYYVDGLQNTNIGTTNTWHHFVMTTTSPISSTALKRIGKSGTKYHSGLLDEVKIYGYLPTLEQIKNFYNSGSINFK